MIGFLGPGVSLAVQALEGLQEPGADLDCMFCRTWTNIEAMRSLIHRLQCDFKFTHSLQHSAIPPELLEHMSDTGAASVPATCLQQQAQRALDLDPQLDRRHQWEFASKLLGSWQIVL